MGRTYLTNWKALIGKKVNVYLYAESSKFVTVTVTNTRDTAGYMEVEFDNNNLWYDERELRLKSILNY